MLLEQIEHRWLAAFRRTLELCALAPGDVVGIVTESQSRQVLVELADLAVQAMGATPVRLRVPTPALDVPAPVRSTGASDALQQLEPVIAALSRCQLVLDCTVEGLLHAPELPRILAGADGVVPRLLMISNEHPEILERCLPDAQLESTVRAAMRRLRGARQMQVSSAAGTSLQIGLDGARVGGVWGYCNKPGQVAHWPGGLCLAFPGAGQVSGTLVLAPGDVNLTFKTYLRDRIVCQIENDHIVAIEGSGVDAEMMRGYYAAWADREGSQAAYAVSHVGWGLNRRARWDALAFYDKRDCNGTELRAFAGNFLYSTGANEVAGRHTLGHFDLPLRNCTVALDGVNEVDQGQLVEPGAQG
ncbi:peptidase M29 [Cupriavidus sp. AU9028]|uniref:peptidase M29 n=1 Tax=Cupriavidus sp. AU9028 TaxID=2871157 RepID=UPI001C97BD50|nr:peptidase M29 [Cupriavidus sp. AU9028]MBY4898191.1 peptidase M29 [Cupriavidus sp. AU9028]